MRTHDEIMREQRNRLYGLAHKYCTQLGMDEEQRRSMLVAQFGKNSMKEIRYVDLMRLVDQLQNRVNERTSESDNAYNDEMNRARKKLIASIGAYLREQNYEENIDKIKAIACRAAKVDRFNAITLSDLKYYASTFSVKAKDLKKLKEQEIQRQAMLN